MASPRRNASSDKAAAGPRILKKYPNRRLYDTQTSSYITLTDVKVMVLASENFEVRDAKTGEDLTRNILLQIIIEEEAGGLPMFSSNVLAQLIRFYGNAMHGVMGPYLEKNLQSFLTLQQQFAEQSQRLGEPSAFTPETWMSMMQGQTPATPDMFSAGMEQSRKLLEQWQKQAGAIFPTAPKGKGDKG